jgi:hypothetical protein
VAGTFVVLHRYLDREETVRIERVPHSACRR